jgi:hypothetical protein
VNALSLHLDVETRASRAFAADGADGAAPTEGDAPSVFGSMLDEALTVPEPGLPAPTPPSAAMPKPRLDPPGPGAGVPELPSAEAGGAEHAPASTSGDADGEERSLRASTLELHSVADPPAPPALPAAPELPPSALPPSALPPAVALPSDPASAPAAPGGEPRARPAPPSRRVSAASETEGEPPISTGPRGALAAQPSAAAASAATPDAAGVRGRDAMRHDDAAGVPAPLLPASSGSRTPAAARPLTSAESPPRAAERDAPHDVPPADAPARPADALPLPLRLDAASPRPSEPPRDAAVPPAQPALPPPPPDADVSGAVLRSAAHLRIDAGALGALDLHLRIRDGALHLRVGGDAAPAIEARSGELSRALAGDGLRLAPIDVRPGDGAATSYASGGGQREPRRDPWAERPEPPPEPRPHRPARRPSASSELAGGEPPRSSHIAVKA